ncbi:hypothetical protein FA13DRAFT_1815916 [Coprinellus micaceus]|uniref:Uncharacterized protein n=1 Tax=Coprinellus micaceus TaxID=71717 RepID=A0A4Y7T356_COPMI|nr:hypothetical protein FA13DRAFT_1815916 [Coprinellus micaceus]
MATKPSAAVAPKPPTAEVPSSRPLKATTAPKPPLRNNSRTTSQPYTTPVKASTPSGKPSITAPVRPASSPPTNSTATKPRALLASSPMGRRQVVSPRTPSLPRANASTGENAGSIGRPSSCPTKVSRDPVGSEKAAAEAKVLALSQRLKKLHLVEALKSNQLSTIQEKPSSSKVSSVTPNRPSIPSGQAKPKVPAQRRPSGSTPLASRAKASSAAVPLIIRPETPRNAAPPPRPAVPTPRTAEFGPQGDRKRIPKVERPTPIKLTGPTSEGPLSPNDQQFK